VTAGKGAESRRKKGAGFRGAAPSGGKGTPQAGRKSYKYFKNNTLRITSIVVYRKSFSAYVGNALKLRAPQRHFLVSE
jgi:hypothetical protein